MHLMYALKFRVKSVSYGGSGTVRCCNVAGTIKMTKVLVSRFTVSRSEFVFKDFGTHAIYGAREIPISYSCVSCFYAPKGLA